jgi:hypothetical protein
VDRYRNLTNSGQGQEQAEEDISEKPPFSAKGRIKPGKNKVWKNRVVIVVEAVGKWAV